MLNQKLLVFDGHSLKSESIEAPGRLRWGCWNGRAGSALVVGDKGTIVVYRGGSLVRLRAATTHNLRAAEFSPNTDQAYACGNAGTIVTTDLHSSALLKNDVRENLRRLSWDPSGTRALIVGNGGAAYLLSDSKLERVPGAETNLRSIAWHPDKHYALVSGNCFRDSVGSLTPSPNLYRYERDFLVEVQGVADSRADLVSMSWKPDGSVCLVVGYDQTWHTPVSLYYDGDRLREISWTSEHVFPTSCAWHPSGRYALIGTSPMKADEGAGSIYRLEDGDFTKLFELGDFGVSCIAWSPEGFFAFVIGSPSLRAYSA